MRDGGLDAKLDQLCSGVMGARTAPAAFDGMLAFARDFGFNSASYIQATDNGGKLVRLTLHTSHKRVAGFYRDENAERFDPFLLHGCKDMRSFFIDRETVTSMAGGDQRQMELFSLAADDGMESALCCPFATDGNARFGGWLLGRQEAGIVARKRTKPLESMMRVATLLTHQKIEGFGTLPYDVNDKKLSPRERECLLWLARGWRVKQIAQKLDISAAAINLYVANAKTKLGAATREQAIAIGILNGQLDL